MRCNLARSKIVLGMTLIVGFNLTLLPATEAFPLRASLITPQKVQPLDPLTPAEIETAKQVATVDQKVKAALGTGRQRLIHVHFIALKPSDTAGDPERLQMGRHARVLFYRYDANHGIEVVVDLERKAVVSVKRIEEPAVPLGRDEVLDAFNIAIRNERVRSLLGPRLTEFRVADTRERKKADTRVEGLRVLATSPRDPCYRRRCVHLLFHDRGRYIVGTSVTVNLTAQTVRVERTIP